MIHITNYERESLTVSNTVTSESLVLNWDEIANVGTARTITFNDYNYGSSDWVTSQGDWTFTVTADDVGDVFRFIPSKPKMEESSEPEQDIASENGGSLDQFIDSFDIKENNSHKEMVGKDEC